MRGKFNGYTFSAQFPKEGISIANRVSIFWLRNRTHLTQTWLQYRSVAIAEEAVLPSATYRG
jgi:hypothetical protein